MKLGDINARLAPLSISVAGLSQLGFEPTRKEGASNLFRECDFTRICAAITRHIAAVAECSLVTA
jgi:hypothetical protein